MTINIALAEDQHLFRAGLLSLLEAIPEVCMLYDSPDGKAFLDAYHSAAIKPDICLIDLEMPHMNGSELCNALIQEQADTRMIILSQYYDDITISAMFEKGVHGYLSKNTSISELRAAIQSVHQTGYYMDDHTLTAIRTSVSHKSAPDMALLLSRREKEILQLICQEYTNQEIAEKLFLSNRTVEGHRNNMLCKTGSRNTAGLVIFALKHGIVTLKEL
ncbi:response regulator [Chitinophaga solisilvae]|uniref:response regulator n=1 Tax=Chitinophaga solisilvae TaxID=1233460 RepID=UPI00136917AD|nr:response regulator transcription factor [Chitinophaga solisilvae]